MDPAQGESGGKSFTSKFKAKVPHPHIGDKVKGLKKRLPGMKKHGGDEHGEDHNSEYDDSPHDSPRGVGPETGYNNTGSTPFTTVKTTPVSSTDRNSPTSHEKTSPRELRNRVYDAKPSYNNPTGSDTRPSYTNPPAYDSENRNFEATAPPTRPAPMATNSSTSNPAPTLEEKFKYLDVGDRSPRVVNPPSESDHQPKQQYPPSTTYPSSTTESIQKGYSDVPRSTYSNPSTPVTLASPASPANKGMVGKVRDSVVGSVAGAAAMVGDRLGYYNEVDTTPRDPNAPSILTKAKSTLGFDKLRDPNAPSVLDKAKSTLGLDKPRDPNAPTLMETTKATLGLDKPRDPNAPSVLDKTKATVGLDKPRDPNAPSILDKTKATLGLDKPRDPNAPPLTEKAKMYVSTASQKTREYSASAADRAAWTKDRLAAQTTPTHHDKALSEQVTQTLSTLPGTIKEKVMGLTSGNTSSSPRSAPAGPGLVDRVSGAVSSLFTPAPKQTGEHLQHTYPAHSDYVQPAASTIPRANQEFNSTEDRMLTTSTPAPPMVNN